VLGAERESLKLAVQQPVLAGPLFDAVEETAYTHPAYVALRRAVAAAGGAIAGTSGPEWIDTLAAACDDPAARAVLPELAVEPFRSDGEPDPRYAGQVLARLQELGVGRQIATVKGRLQRLNPVEKPEEHSRLFGELVGLEQHKRALRDQAIGAL
jgi:DNA primase